MVPIKYSSTSPMTQIFLEMIFLCPSSISQTASLGHMRLNLNSTFDFPLTGGWEALPSLSEDPGLYQPETQRDRFVFE